MANIREILNKINSISSTQQITKAMKMVAASKLNKVQSKSQGLQPYLRTMNEMILKLSGNDVDSSQFPHFQTRELNNALFVVIASDRGLCGSFNSNILKFTRAAVEDFKRENPLVNVSVMPIGIKAQSYFKKLDYSILDLYSQVQAKFSIEDATKMSNFLTEEFLAKRVDKIFLCYTHFKSTSSNEAVIEEYLPIDIKSLLANVALEVKKMRSDTKWIFETPAQDILAALLPIYIRIKMYDAVIQSGASEHSSRMISMNKASDNAEAMRKALKIDYNRKRQASITQEISEIVSGAESLIN